MGAGGTGAEAATAADRGVEPGELRSVVPYFRLPCFSEGVSVFIRVYPVGVDCPLHLLRPRRLLPLDLRHRRLNPLEGSVEGGGGRLPTEEVWI